MPPRVTLLDVAREAGVSRATASLVVRDSPLVADATRKKVLATMEKLGYVYNRAAASLRTRHSRAVGLIVTEIGNPFFAQMTVDCQNILEEAGYITLLSNTSENLDRQERILTTMHEYDVDGLIICPAVNTDVKTVSKLRQWQLPSVFVSRHAAEMETDYVGADNIRGAEFAVEHLLSHCHERIAFIGGLTQSSSRQERLQGYYNALERNGIRVDEALTIASPVTQSGGQAAISALLQRPDPPSAALCYNDVVAFGVMTGLQREGIKPGDDFCVIGFDNIESSETWHPPLTTVSVIPESIGTTAARLLLERIANPSNPTQIKKLNPQLIIRRSCGGHTNC